MQLETCGQSVQDNGDEIMREIEREINLRAELPLTVLPGVADGVLPLPQPPEIRFLRMLGSGCFGSANYLTLGSVFEVDVRVKNPESTPSDENPKVSRRKSSGKISCPKVIHILN